jgi:hypothetical protein
MLQSLNCSAMWILEGLGSNLKGMKTPNLQGQLTAAELSNTNVMYGAWIIHVLKLVQIETLILLLYVVEGSNDDIPTVS